VLGFVVAIAALLLASACGGDGDAASNGKLRVVTSLEIFADMARQVGGDRVEVTALLPPGADPHTFELAPARVVDVVRADLVFINGLNLEHSIEGVVDENAEGDVIKLAEGLPVFDAENEGDPHLWLDPRLAARYIETIRDALIATDPAGTSAYKANAAAYLDTLGQLDAEMEQAIAAIPAERRKLVTFHDAYAYLASRYGLEVVAVVAPSPGQEPSARAVAELVQAIRDEGVPAVYTEPQFNSDVLDRAADEAGVRVLDLLSDAYAHGVDSYIGLLRYDLEQLKEGLGGD
jgi:ABC-type Zn uptake system ZnuABC Zn-binding protein ZnuA